MTREQALTRITQIAEELDELQQRFMGDDVDVMSRHNMLQDMAEEAYELLEEN